MRLFVSVDPPPDAVAHLAAAVATLAVSRANTEGHSTRLTRPEQWHVTLAFIGEVEEAKVDAAATALSRVTPVELVVRFAGGGTFGRGPSAILWAGITGDIDGLRRLADDVRRQMRRAHVHFDHKPFKPHLTLSRPGTRVERADLVADVETLAGYAGPAWPVTAVHLVRSELGPQPRYTRLASSPLY
jgi:RNA 2',3'-cyclic 3'-phosphodiesterase